jgi:N-acetylglucosaminyldiphosphoundecaprenol N-acetyl-beta-D-mannosaminyltransferase
MQTQANISCPPKKSVVGVGVSTTSYSEVVQVCRQWILARTVQTAGHYICVTSVHGIVAAAKSSALKAVLNRADITTPDGMPVVWALRSFGARQQTRVYGPDLMLALCRDAERFGHRIYLYGATEDTIAKLRRRLLELFPGLIICGSWAPPFVPLTAEEDELATRRILESGADIVFVGMSTPKQDYWMFEHAPRLPGTILVGVGAAFLFHAGMVPQAPYWMQRNGLEWFFRLCMEPARLWRRYVIETPVFLPLWALQRMGILKFQLSSPLKDGDSSN